MRSFKLRWLAAALVLAAPACGGGAATSGGGRGSIPAATVTEASAPAEAVERFMRLVGTKDYVQMGYLFGTREGPIIRRDPEPQVERRMYAIADILQNERYVIRGQQGIPGRGPDATELMVQVTRGGENHDVPFVVVRTIDGHYLVEQIGLERITKSDQ